MRKKNFLNVNDDERNIIFKALRYYLYFYCFDNLQLFLEVNCILDKYFNLDDYLYNRKEF